MNGSWARPNKWKMRNDLATFRVRPACYQLRYCHYASPLQLQGHDASASIITVASVSGRPQNPPLLPIPHKLGWFLVCQDQSYNDPELPWPLGGSSAHLAIHIGSLSGIFSSWPDLDFLMQQAWVVFASRVRGQRPQTPPV